MRSRRVAIRRNGGSLRRVGLANPNAAGEALALEDADQAIAQTLAARVVLDPEDRPQDHLERDRLHARVERELGAQRPGRDGALGRLADHLLVGAHALAVKRRQHQLAAAQVLVALLKSSEDRAEQRLEDDVAPRGDRVDPVGGEQPLQRLGVGEEDDLARPEEAGMKVSPRRARQCSRNGSGRKTKRAVCTDLGSGTLGSSANGRAVPGAEAAGAVDAIELAIAVNRTAGRGPQRQGVIRRGTRPHPSAWRC